MRRSIAALLVAATATLPAATAESAPAFPVLMEVEYSIGDRVLSMEVVIEGDSTFSDSDGDEGIWFYRRRDNTVLFRYEGDVAGFDLYGVRDRSCFTGTVLEDERPVGEWEGCF